MQERWKRKKKDEKQLGRVCDESVRRVRVFDQLLYASKRLTVQC